MKILLVDRREDLVNEWNKGVPVELNEMVEIYQDDIFNHHPSNFIVSPANSFGYMNGGVDLAMTNRFGENLSERLRSIIQCENNGELLVGQATTLYITDDPDYQYLISAPTMRVPRIIKNYEDVYLATRAAMREFMEYRESEDDTILFTGMGSNTGRVPLNIVAQCMFHGIQDVLTPKPYPISWYNAQSEMMFITGQM